MDIEKSAEARYIIVTGGDGFLTRIFTESQAYEVFEMVFGKDGDGNVPYLAEFQDKSSEDWNRHYWNQKPESWSVNLEDGYASVYVLDDTHVDLTRLTPASAKSEEKSESCECWFNPETGCMEYCKKHEQFYRRNPPYPAVPAQGDGERLNQYGLNAEQWNRVVERAHATHTAMYEAEGDWDAESDIIVRAFVDAEKELADTLRRLAEVERERDRQYEENVHRIAEQGAAELRAERAEAKLAEVEAANRWIPVAEAVLEVNTKYWCWIEPRESYWFDVPGYEHQTKPGTWKPFAGIVGTYEKRDGTIAFNCGCDQKVTFYYPLPPEPTTDSTPAVSEEKA